METSLYIHIPFCRRRCIYCDFYSVIHEESLAASYIDVVSSEIRNLKKRFSTIYIGGGTPTALGMSALSRVLESLSGKMAAQAEFTVEANPESLDADKLKLFRDSGVNRISIGLQSLTDAKLKRLGRIHYAAKGKEAVLTSSKAGFKNISVDLIFGVWGEDIEGWGREFEEATRLPVKHISCYSLTCEKGTPLFEAVKNGSVAMPGDDTVGSMYEAAIERLALRGFKQYEVSNFSKVGYECRHNMNYWRNDPYVGVGASAVSYENGIRKTNISDVKEYIRRYGDGEDCASSSERLPPIKRAKETAAVKIRTREGIDFGWFKEKTGFDFLTLEKKALPRLIEDGLVRYKKTPGTVTGIELRHKGFLLADLVSSELL